VLVHPGHKYFLFCNNKKVSCQAFGELAYEFGEPSYVCEYYFEKKEAPYYA